MLSRKDMVSKTRITADLVFDTAFHVGSGHEGEMATVMGVLRESGSGFPILPGSSLKGNFRSMAERLAPHLGMQACLLDPSLSEVECFTDENFRRQEMQSREYRNLTGEKARLLWLQSRVCDVCALFGSPMHASRIFFRDGRLRTLSETVEIRDGVCIDRDSETARNGFKYDFEVVPAGTSFSVAIDIENPDTRELALVGAVLSEWEQGFRVGGKTSRGLGAARLASVSIGHVDFRDRSLLTEYLIKKTMPPAPTLFTDALEQTLKQQGANHA